MLNSIHEAYSCHTILIADDDPDDQFLIEEAWAENKIVNPLHFVADGLELLDYLKQRGEYAAPARAPRPGFILLDLNMPKMDGREVLQQLKNDKELCSIPVIVLTTSRAEKDILCSYATGACSYISKPVTFDKLVEVVSNLHKYWLGFVELPANTIEI
jgi:two-component system response regulator